VLLRVEVAEFELIDALQAAGRLSTEDGLDRTCVEREVARLIGDWISRWDVTHGLEDGSR
jgi:hypothetical protein